MVYTLQQNKQNIGLTSQSGSKVALGNQATMRKYFSDIINTLNALPLGQVEAVVGMVEQARNTGKRVYIFGNGGSAATASHFACDLAKGAISEGKPRIKVFPLTDSTPLFSAWANDNNYGSVFVEQLKNYIEPEDIVIAISGSGNSPNVVNAVKEAKSRGAVTIGFTGFDGGQLNSLVDISVPVPNHTMEQVEDVHLILAHLITTMLRTRHFNIICATNDVEVLQNTAERLIKQHLNW